MAKFGLKITFCVGRKKTRSNAISLYKNLEKVIHLLQFIYIFTGEKLRFYSNLAKNVNPKITVQLDDMENEKKIYHGQNHYMIFVVDLNCPNIQSYLEKVQ
jgi:hypothetical protein